MSGFNIYRNLTVLYRTAHTQVIQLRRIGYDSLNTSVIFLTVKRIYGNRSTNQFLFVVVHMFATISKICMHWINTVNRMIMYVRKYGTLRYRTALSDILCSKIYSRYRMVLYHIDLLSCYFA